MDSVRRPDRRRRQRRLAARRASWQKRRLRGQPRLAPGLKLVAVNGDKFTPEGPEGSRSPPRKITAACRSELILQSGDTFSTVKVNYHGGLRRFPQLERLEGSPDRIADIAKARNMKRESDCHGRLSCHYFGLAQACDHCGQQLVLGGVDLLGERFERVGRLDADRGLVEDPGPPSHLRP